MQEKKLTVLVVGPLPPPVGGMGTYVQDYLRSEVVRAVCVRLIPFDLIGKYRFNGPVRIVLNLVNAMALALTLLRDCIRWRPDIVHVHTGSCGGFFEKSALILLARLAGCKALLHNHGGRFGEFYRNSPQPVQRLISRCLRLSHAVVTPSRQMVRLLTDAGACHDRVFCQENAVFVPKTGIGSSAFGHMGSDNDQSSNIRVLFLNRCVPTKGLFEVVEAGISLCRKYTNIEFRIIGPENEHTRSIRQRLKRHGLDGRIRICRPIYDLWKKHGAYQAAHIYVLPSYSENLPMGLLEAAAHGLACIVTPVGGIPEVIIHRKNGLLVPVKNPAKLADAIESCVLDDALRKHLGHHARQTIRQRFSWEVRASEIIALYRRMTATSSAEA